MGVKNAKLLFAKSANVLSCETFPLYGNCSVITPLCTDIISPTINQKICSAGKLKDVVLVMQSQRMLSQDEIRIQGHSMKEKLSAVVA